MSGAADAADQRLAAPQHALSVDLEDWYHDGNQWTPGIAEHIEANTEHLLELLARADARATFFVLGDVAERYPRLLHLIAKAGHEIGSHSYAHRKVMELTRREFYEDTQRSLQAIEQVTGQAVDGYRAPYFSIKADVLWPVEILAELGLRYDASILGIDRPPGLDVITPRAPYPLRNGLWEVPVALLNFGFFWNLPLASGVGLRFLPSVLFDRFVRRFENEVGPGVFYLHPWELDEHAPTAPGFSRWFIRAGRARLPQRLERLLSRRRFSTIATAFPHVISAPTAVG